MYARGARSQVRRDLVLAVSHAVSPHGQASFHPLSVLLIHKSPFSPSCRARVQNCPRNQRRAATRQLAGHTAPCALAVGSSNSPNWRRNDPGRRRRRRRWRDARSLPKEIEAQRYVLREFRHRREDGRASSVSLASEPRKSRCSAPPAKKRYWGLQVWLRGGSVRANGRTNRLRSASHLGLERVAAPGRWVSHLCCRQGGII